MTLTITYNEVEDLAEKLHREFRAAFKALHKMAGNGTYNECAGCVDEHDHGWSKCHRKGYFRNRAKRMLENERLEKTI
jgi:hypothetical protein